MIKKLLLAAGLLVAIPFAGAADVFPSRPVTIVVPYSAGGPIDAFMRALAEGLSAQWKQPVLIDNRPGANEIIAADLVARSAADGHVILAASESALLLNPLLYKKLPYDPGKQLASVSLLVKAPLVFTVPASSPVKTMKEFISYARDRRSNPVPYGSQGVGGPPHLAFSTLMRDHSIELLHVPYKGGVPVMQALLSDDIGAGVIGATMMEQHVKSGKLKGLAVSAETRLPSLPDVPTFKELGIHDIHADYFTGLVVPAKPPVAVIDKIARDSRTVLMKPDFLAKNVEPFALVAIGSTPKEFLDYLKSDLPVQAQRVKDSGVQLELNPSGK